MSSKNAKSSGVGFLGLLSVLFIGLKLTGYITWSWWWVLAPLWAWPCILFAVAGICFLLAAIIGS